MSNKLTNEMINRLCRLITESQPAPKPGKADVRQRAVSLAIFLTQQKPGIEDPADHGLCHMLNARAGMDLTEKYGRPLETENGRMMLADAIQEGGDKAFYLAGEVLENPGDSEAMELFRDELELNSRIVARIIRKLEETGNGI